MTCICFVYPFLGFSGMHGSVVERFTPFGAASANARNTDGAAQKWQGWAKARAALESRTLSFNAKVLWSDMHGESPKDTWILQGVSPTNAETKKIVGQTAWEERHPRGWGHLETCVCLTKQRSQPQNGKTVQKGLCDCGGS